MMDPVRENDTDGKKYRPYSHKIIALVIALVIVVSGFTVFYTIENGRQDQGSRTLVVYTYDGFMASGINTSHALSVVFGTFEKKYNVNLEVKNESNLLQLLLAEKSNPKADIVIGLDNINGLTAVSNGLLVKYVPPAEKYVNSTLLSEMGSTSGYLTPYEYSYLGIDYYKPFLHNQTFQPSFGDIINNTTLASNLLVEYPQFSETGQEFLLWEIAYYTYVLHENWTKWWTSMAPYMKGHIYDSWSSAWSQYSTGPDTNLLVSYLTDPAYNKVWGYNNTTGSTVTFHAGKAYGWRSIYGLGIVNGSRNLNLDREFVNYFLSPTVQNEIPNNEFMFPANSTVSLPASFRSVQNQADILALNQYMSSYTVEQNLTQWETEWLNVMV